MHYYSLSPWNVVKSRESPGQRLAPDPHVEGAGHRSRAIQRCSPRHAAQIRTEPERVRRACGTRQYAGDADERHRGSPDDIIFTFERNAVVHRYGEARTCRETALPGQRPGSYRATDTQRRSDLQKLFAHIPRYSAAFVDSALSEQEQLVVVKHLTHFIEKAKEPPPFEVDLDPEPI